MTEEFNLSEKITQMGIEGMTYPMLDPKDVREFIKRLKDYIKYAKWWQAKSRMELYNEIDKLAGEKLTSSLKEGGKGK